MKVGILGRSGLLLDAAKNISKTDHEIVFVMTCAEAEYYSAGQDDFSKLAVELGVPYKSTEKINSPEVQQWIKDQNPEIGVSVNWKTVIKQETLDIFTQGVINAHVGDLPRYKGNATVNWAIINNEDKVVITLHKMAAELDSGPIFLQKEYPLTNDTYVGDVYKFMGEMIPDMFVEVVDGISNGNLSGKEQSSEPKDSLRCYPRCKQDGEINWNNSTDDIYKLIRATSDPFSGSYTVLDNEKLIIWKAHPENPESPFLGVPGQVAHINKSEGTVTIITGDGMIALQTVESNNSGIVKASEIIKSIRARLG